MKKKTFMATIIIITAFLISSVAGMQAVNMTKANPIGWFYPQINFTIQSLNDGAHVSLPILINFTASSNFGISLSNGSFLYVLDNQDVNSSGVKFTQVQSNGLFNFSGQANITNLATGKHTIIIYYVGMYQESSPFHSDIYTNGSLISTTTQFYVDAETSLPTSISAPTLSVPEFTLKFIDNSYVVPPRAVASTDPYTRVTTTTKYPSYYAENKSIEVIITNQPIDDLNICYDVALKDHNSENWTTYSYYNDFSIYEYGVTHYLQASSSATTVLTFGLDSNNGSDTYTLMMGNVKAGDQVDFQVQAYTRSWNIITEVNPVTNSTYVFNESLADSGSFGAWSPTQTITIPQSSPSLIPTLSPVITSSPFPTQQPTTEPPPTQNLGPPNEKPPSLFPIVFLIAVVAIIVIGAAGYVNFKKKGSNKKGNKQSAMNFWSQA